ncbi:DUF3426 domain-containing protein [Microbulbifer variabilis]|uniref:DUF3426 domain-containing protein n=1 Tax=Microbulbifer variabilis TaxID=266805 RepID=UPI001CFD6D31|nr:DUF3426 domain-containing protein [Microbulbifer variabilis]
MSQLVTRCPHCSTSFHINDQQLRAARGAVRCGSCLQVFRADENIVFNDNGPDARSDLETLLEDDDFLIHDDIELEDDDPAEETAAANSSEKQPPGNITDRESAGNTSHETPVANSESLIGDAFGDNEWQELQEEDQFEEGPEEDLESILKPDWDDVPDFDSSATGTDEDSLSPADENERFGDPEPWERPLESQAPAIEPYESEPTPEAPSASEEILPVPLPEAGNGRKEPYFATGADSASEPQAEPVREQLISAIQPAPVEMTWGAASSKKAVSPWLWRLLLPFLTLLLLIQLAYFQFDRLSKQQPWRDIYASVCPMLGCTLPPLRDSNAIQASNLMVRSHPQLEGALVVDAVLVNSAPYPQPFPNLLLNFSDLKNKAVASRRFTPEEYLQGELAGRKQMPQGSPIHIAIEVVDPGAEAVNYEMKIAP